MNYPSGKLYKKKNRHSIRENTANGGIICEILIRENKARKLRI